MNKQEYLKKFAEKLSITAEQTEKDFAKCLKEITETHIQLSPEEQETRAIQRLALLYKRQMKSPAVGFEGLVLASSDAVDIVAKVRKTATDKFRENPAEAVALGITDSEGNPLDARETWANGKTNFGYGKLLPEHNFIKNVWGVFKKSDSDTEPKFLSMVLSGELAKADTPIMKPVRFMAIEKEDKLNPCLFTKFVIDDTIKLPPLKDLITNYLGVKKISELESYHTLNKDDYNRLVAVEGDVSGMNLEPTAFGSRILNLEDMDASLEDLDAIGTTCWMPERIEVDFAEGSKVIVIGRTGQSKVKDEAGNPTEELGDITMNVYGIYAIPEFKVNLPEEMKPVTEDSVDIQ